MMHYAERLAFDTETSISPRQRTLGAYGSFGEVAPTPGQIVTERVAAMVKVNDVLWAALAKFEQSATATNKARIRYEVENWHTNAKKWMDSADEASKSDAKFKGWRAWGATISKSADDIGSKMGSSTIGSAVYDFMANFPTSLGVVTKTAVKGVTSIATTVAEGAGEAGAAAAWGVGKMLLFVGIPLAVILLMATSGGRGINVGPVRLGK